MCGQFGEGDQWFFSLISWKSKDALIEGLFGGGGIRGGTLKLLWSYDDDMYAPEYFRGCLG